MDWGEARAIETRYAGCRFRSRLEARWAVFLTTVAVEWEYEPEGFDLDGVWYLPDFWLPRLGWWVEVKPAGMTYDAQVDVGDRASRLTRHTRKPTIVLRGGFDTTETEEGGAYVVYVPDDEVGVGWWGGVQWAACLTCEDVAFTDGGRHVPLPASIRAGYSQALEAQPAVKLPDTLAIKPLRHAVIGGGRIEHRIV